MSDRLSQGSLVNLAGAAGSALSTLALVVLTARVLTPAEAGRVFAVTSAFLILAAVLRAGTPTGVVLFVSRADDATGGTSRRIARRGVRPVLLASAGVGVVALALADRLGAALGTGAVVVVVLALCLPAATALDTVLAVTRGEHDMVPTVLVDRVGRPVLQLALTGLAALHPTVPTVVVAWSVPYVVALVAAWALTPALRSRTWPPGPDGEGREFRDFVLARGAASVIQICFARLDIVLVAALAGPAQAALYTVATRFVTVAQLVQQAIATAGEPALGRTMARRELPAALGIYRTTTLWVLTLLWPMLITAAVVSPEWLGVFGPAYRTGVDVVVVLTLAMLVATGVGMVETVLNMGGRATVLLVNNVAALVVMVGLDLLLVPGLGAVGAACGWAAAIVVKNLLALAQLRGTLPGLPFGRAWLLGACLNVVLVGALPLACGLAWGPPGRWTGVVVGGTLLAAAYVALRGELGLARLFGRARTRPEPVAAAC
ncbi:lipopolysaccharide biosynthesis protein [Nocardioides sp. URHA0020]|uniref:lipopolysaccharide biosynthesis protein n=1 Tax=Nocardioides sp. URHA0020 TaxID=1380392 RepID=UPI000685F11F|nr:lipopolysaccharide biosynthesis protein [Nocardioides sp. URHA0020]